MGIMRGRDCHKICEIETNIKPWPSPSFPRFFPRIGTPRERQQMEPQPLHGRFSYQGGAVENLNVLQCDGKEREKRACSKVVSTSVFVLLRNLKITWNMQSIQLYTTLDLAPRLAYCLNTSRRSHCPLEVMKDSFYYSWSKEVTSFMCVEKTRRNLLVILAAATMLHYESKKS
jgi:hypothetical protein